MTPGPSLTRPASAAIVIGLATAFVTAAVVSWATPDGNLVVTLVPALVLGLVAFGIASWRLRRGGARQGEVSMVRRLLLLVFIVLAVLTAVWAIPRDAVTSRYATLQEARADRLFKRGWLPDLLPPSTHDLRVSAHVDLNNATGEFHFSPAEFNAFGRNLGPYTKPKSPFTGFADSVDAHLRRGYPALQYVTENNTWVFLCKPEQGICSYAMWLSR
jgi:hypothetical protein